MIGWNIVPSISLTPNAILFEYGILVNPRISLSSCIFWSLAKVMPEKLPPGKISSQISPFGELDYFYFFLLVLDLFEYNYFHQLTASISGLPLLVCSAVRALIALISAYNSVGIPYSFALRSWWENVLELAESVSVDVSTAERARRSPRETFDNEEIK